MNATARLQKCRPIFRMVPIVAAISAVLSGAAEARQSAQTAPKKDDEKLERIVVTATKREESIQEVPVAVTVVAGDRMEQLNLNNMSTITSQVPTLNFRANASNKDTALFIRGVGTISTSPGVEPTVSTVVDGVVFPRPGMATLDLMDVDRIEVLRGPQGTLFGKNASAGVLNIVSVPLSAIPEKYIDVSFFQGREQRVRAGISGELAPGILASLTAYAGEYDGNVDNTFLGRKVNGYDRSGARVKFQINPAKDVKVTLIGDYTRGDDNGIRGPYVRASAAINATHAPIVPSLENRSVSTDVDERVHDTNSGVSAQVDWDVKGGTFTSITALREWRNTQFQDIDGTAPTPLSSQIAQLSDRGELKSDVVTQELRFASAKGKSFDYVAGAYFMRNETNEVYRRDVARCNGTLASLPNGLTPCAAQLNDFGRAEYGTLSKSSSLFGEATFHASATLRGVFGLRYTRDELSYYHSRFSTAAAAIPGVQPTRARVAGNTEETGVSGRIGPQFDISKNMMMYATFSRGYKGPAYNAFFNMQPSADIALEPETSKGYEIGFKSTLLNNRMTLNLAAFDTKYKGYQANYPDLVGGVVVTRFINAGDVSTKGFELDLEAKLTRQFSVALSLANTKARVDRFNCPTGAACPALDGQPLPSAPDWKGVLRANWWTDLSNGMRLNIGADTTYSSAVQFDLSTSPNTIQPSYRLYNAFIALSKDEWRISLIGKNLGDKSYAAFLLPGANTQRSVPRDDERFFGVNVRYSF